MQHVQRLWSACDHQVLTTPRNHCACLETLILATTCEDTLARGSLQYWMEWIWWSHRAQNDIFHRMPSFSWNRSIHPGELLLSHQFSPPEFFLQVRLARKKGLSFPAVCEMVLRYDMVPIQRATKRLHLRFTVVVHRMIMMHNYRHILFVPPCNVAKSFYSFRKQCKGWHRWFILHLSPSNVRRTSRTKSINSTFSKNTKLT